MANRNEHCLAGGFGGCLAAGYYAINDGRDPLEISLESLGGLMAGTVVATLPDIIDPPTSPRHRSVGHAIAPSAALARGALELARRYQKNLRDEAKVINYMLECEESTLGRIALFIGLVGLLLAAGAVIGLVGGYFSHHVLDMGTKRGLPLLW